MENDEKFKNITAGIQSIVVSIAAIIAGLWGIYEFNISREDRVDELEQIRINQEISRIPIVQLDLQAILLETEIDDLKYIKFIAEISNLGTEPALLHFTTSANPDPAYLLDYMPFSFAKLIEYPNDPEIIRIWNIDNTELVRRFPIDSISPKEKLIPELFYDGSATLKIGEIITLEFIVSVSEKGVYLGTIEFNVIDDSIDEGIDYVNRVLGDSGATYSYTQSTYILVPEF